MRTVDILFVHNNFPAQFRNLAGKFAAMPGVRVKAIGAGKAPGLPDMDLRRYHAPQGRAPGVHPFARRMDLEARRAETVMYEAIKLRDEGFSPTLVYVHPGWGEALPLRSVFPDATICAYAEFFYAARGTDVGFDREFDSFGIDGEVRIAMRNASTLLALADCDFAVTPSEWQYSVFPHSFHDKLHIVHDGLNLERLVPGRGGRFLQLPGLAIEEDDEVITYISRSLEPYRGFHVFMRALPEILAARPRARVLLLGNDGVSYGAMPRGHRNWRERMLAELGENLDLSRVHFLGWVDYSTCLSVLRRSDAHVYLTYPFVLSWSMLEAMALECLVVGSDTAPVAEVIRDGENGLLVPFFDRAELVATLVDALANREAYLPLRRAARESVLARYDFETHSWPQHQALLRDYCPSGDLARVLDSAAGSRQRASTAS